VHTGKVVGAADKQEANQTWCWGTPVQWSKVAKNVVSGM